MVVTGQFPSVAGIVTAPVVVVGMAGSEEESLPIVASLFESEYVHVMPFTVCV